MIINKEFLKSCNTAKTNKKRFGNKFYNCKKYLLIKRILKKLKIIKNPKE